MSRQMAFQLTYPQLVQKWAVLAKASGSRGDAKTVGEWIDSITEDQHERDVLTAAYSALHNCTKHNRDLKDVVKVICWRGADGKPSDIQVELTRKTG